MNKSVPDYVSVAAGSDVPSLGIRNPLGQTRISEYWGINSEYGVLRDVLLGSPECFRWMGDENLAYSSICRSSDRLGLEFNRDVAIRQHKELILSLIHISEPTRPY